MSKKNLLISTALTVFVLVILANVVTVYAQIRKPAGDVATQPVTTVADVLPAQNQVAQVTHQEAANIAARFLGQSDLYSAENAVWNGVDAYKIVFSSGYVVYVSLDGQILGSEAPQTVFVSAPAGNGNVNSPSTVKTSSHSENDH